MKQHITVEQMKEIEDKTLAKYMDLQFKHLLEAVCYYGAKKPLGRDKLNKMAEMITVGKMIEILTKENRVMVEQDWDKHNDYGWWVVTVYKEGFIDCRKFWNATELADALWESVKYVLEEDNE